MLGPLPREPVDEVLQIPPSLLTCGGCQQNIGDRYFLKAIDQYWHEDCLSCDLCGCRLGEVGRRLYYKLGRKLCRRDYLRYVPAPLRAPGTLGRCPWDPWASWSPPAPVTCPSEVRRCRLGLSCPPQRVRWPFFLSEAQLLRATVLCGQI